MRAIVLVVALAGCIKPATFACASDGDCGTSGTCEAVGRCSFPDPTCASGARFAGLSGSYANQCVADAAPDAGTPDARIDAAIVAIDAAPDVAIDAAPHCPAGYVELPGLTTTHRYRLLTSAAGWTNQRAICGAEPANAYLAVPDDEAELHALIALAATDVWVGISDASTEGVYATVHGTTATYLPWAPAEPDNVGNQDCVRALLASRQLETNTCGVAAVGICECEP